MKQLSIRFWDGFYSEPGVAGQGFDNRSPEEKVVVKDVNHENSGSPHYVI